MLKEITTRLPFFEDPHKIYSAREIARKTGTNHITVSKRLGKFDFIGREINGDSKLNLQLNLSGFAGFITWISYFVLDLLKKQKHFMICLP